MDGVKTEYGSVDGEGLPYSKDIDDYLTTTFDGEELIAEVGLDPTAPFWSAVSQALSDTVWCERDPLALRPDEQAIASWDRFADLVTHRVRFVVAEYEPDDDWFTRADAPIPPREMLGYVGRTTDSVPGMITTLPTGQSVFRCRWATTHSDRYTTAEQLGSPPAAKARANRMSPEGISVFCGAFDRETALVETKQSDSIAGFLATFVLLRHATVLDLTQAPAVPSLWDTANRWTRSPIRFLSAFQKAVSQKVDRAAASYEYAPTQFLAEWFRWVYRTRGGQRLDGIVYPSAQVPSGRNVVLFVDGDGCCDTPGEGCLLRLMEVEPDIDPKSLP